MSATIPVPVWLFILIVVLFAAREYFSAKRNDTMRQLYTLHFDDDDATLTDDEGT